MTKSVMYSMEKYLQISLMLDVREPMKDCVLLKLQEGKLCFIPVKYKHLSMVCFYNVDWGMVRINMLMFSR